MYSSTHFCEKDIAKVMKYAKSQSSEDEFLSRNFFKNRCNGTYVELGGLDGVRYSNSHLFHYGFQWHGILIEPSPSSFKALEMNRPKDNTFNYAVCSSPRDVHFVEGREKAVSGILEFMAPSFIATWHSNSTKKPATLSRISCKSLSDILDESSLPQKQVIDFLSIDVEGAEFEVVQTIDFSRHVFGVIFYEADEYNPVKNEVMKTFLESKGYTFRSSANRSNFHINNRWHEIYNN